MTAFASENISNKFNSFKTKSSVTSNAAVRLVMFVLFIVHHRIW